MNVRTTRCCILAACVLAAGVATTARADAKQDVLDKLKGSWSLVMVSQGGHELDAEKAKAVTVMFDGTSMIMKRGDDKHPSTITIVDAEKSPGWIDMHDDKTVDKAMGIYKLDGDTLELCFKEKERPTDFTAGKDTLVMKLKRQK